MFRTLQLTKLGQNLLQKSGFLNLASVPRRCMGVYEPDYLDKILPQEPIYDLINIEIHGYDFPICESYQKFVHEACELLELSVNDCWALPAKVESITRLKPNTSVIESTYTLNTYKRVVQLEQVKAYQIPLLVRVIQAGLPAGVKFNVMEHSEMHDIERYVPDKELIQLKQDLESAGGAPKKKKRF